MMAVTIKKFSGQKLGGSDFDRDSGDDSDGRDDKRFEDDDKHRIKFKMSYSKVAKKYDLSAIQLYVWVKNPKDFNSWENMKIILMMWQKI